MGLKPVGSERCSHQAWIDAVEHQLGSTEHLELATRVDLAPREIDEPVAKSALHDRSTKVEGPVVVDHIDVDVPSNLCGVSRGEIDGFTSELHTNVDVEHRRPVGPAELMARKVGPDDRHSHEPILPRIERAVSAQVKPPHPPSSFPQTEPNSSAYHAK